MNRPIEDMTRDELIDALAKERAYTEVLEVSIELEVQKRLDNAVRDEDQSEYELGKRQGYGLGKQDGQTEGFRLGRANGYQHGFNDAIDKRYRGFERPDYESIDRRTVDARSKQPHYRDLHSQSSTVTTWRITTKRLDGRE